jgi:hypothetical protein
MAIEDARKIKVLEFDEDEAYDPERPISGLIRNQLLHLHHAENLVVPAQSRTNININNLLTERQASDYIHKVTQLLHRFGKLDRARKPAKKGRTPAKVATKSTKKSQTPAKQTRKSAKKAQTPAKQTRKSTKKTQRSVRKADTKQRKKTRNKSKSR